MAMKPEDNELLTAVAGSTPMGRLLRQYWIPVMRSTALEAGGAPRRTTLLGDKFVAFRSPNGRVGLLDEACPHRGVSMALARNEDDGLRCIFHGWKFDVGGKLIDAPCEPENRRADFCRHAQVNRYVAHEAGGVVWAYLGQGEAPPFPDFEFNTLPPEHVCIRRAVVPYNWVQGIEAHIDSSHVAWLHSGFLTVNRDKLQAATADNLAAMMEDKSPRLEMDEMPYGLREGALRSMPGGKTYARIREIVLPFYTFIPGPEGGPYSGRISVPIDEHNSAEWYVLYNPDRPLTEADVDSLFFNASDDPDNFAANLGTAEGLWDQDREAMKHGHFSGLIKNLSFEDFVVQASMGARFDRSKEQLGAADAIIVKVRRMLLEAMRARETGNPAPWNGGFAYPSIRARSIIFDSGAQWRSFSYRQGASVPAADTAPAGT